MLASVEPHEIIDVNRCVFAAAMNFNGAVSFFFSHPEVSLSPAADVKV